MLHTIRKLRKSLLGLILVGLLALTMLPFGSGLSKSLDSNNKAAIRVGDKEFSFYDYQKALEESRRKISAQFGANASKFMKMFNLEQQTIDQLINNALLEELIKKLGFSASVAQIEAAVSAHPYFGGRPSRESYESFLRSQGMTGSQLEEQMRKEIIKAQLFTLLSDFNVPSDLELKQAWLDQNRKASFFYLAYAAASFEGRVENPSDEILKQYFTDHADSYRKPKSVAFTALPFRPTDYLSKVEISSDDLKEAYEQQANTLSVPAQVRLRRIVIKPSKSKNVSELEKMLEVDSAADQKDKDGEQDSAKAKLEKVMAELAGTKSFSDVAAAYSDDPSAAKNGGDLGWKKYSDLDAPIRTAVARLQPQEHTQAIDTKEGKEIYFVEEKQDKRTKTFEEVKSYLELDLRKADAPQYAQNAAESFQRKWEEQSRNQPVSLSDFAKGHDKQVLVTEKPISRDSNNPDFPSALIDKVLGIAQGEHDIVLAGDTPYLIEVTTVKEAYIPDLAEVREEVLVNYRQNQAKVLAKEAAQNALKKLQEKARGATSSAAASEEKIDETLLNEIGAAFGIKAVITEAAARSNAQGPFLSTPEDRRDIFTLSKAQPVARRILSVDDSYYVIALASSIDPDESQFEKDKAQLRVQQMQRGGVRLMETLLKELKSETTIYVNPDLLNKQTTADE